VNLFPHQKKLCDDIVSAWRSGARSVCAVLPTGGGKTHIAAFFAEQALKCGRGSISIAHRDNLIRQLHETFLSCEIPHGIIAPGMPRTDDLVQIASVNTLVRKLDRIGLDDPLIIVDECHHIANDNQWMRCMRYYENSVKLGLTATPVRTDGFGLGVESGGMFDRLAVGPSMLHLIDIGRLVPIEYYGPSRVHFDPVGASMSGSDFSMTDTERALKKSQIVGDAVLHYQIHTNGLRALAFNVSINAAEETAEAFRNAGIPARCINGKQGRHEQRRLIDSLANKEILVLTSVSVISEGTDIPAVDCGIDMAPTTSFGLDRQRKGRIMRVCPGKTKGYWLDMAGNMQRHGFADDEVIWNLNPEITLNTRVCAPQLIKARQCERCFKMYKSGAICPYCGHEHNGQRVIELTDGQLVRIEREMMKQKQLDKSESARQEVKKKMDLVDWIKWSMKYGYKPEYALTRHNSRGNKSTYAELHKLVREVKNGLHQ
jgi:DNA repair protein RadD